MVKPSRVPPHKLAGVSVPLFWPMTVAAQMVEQGIELYARNLSFLAEEEKIDHGLRPSLATANRVVLDLRTMVFRDYSRTDAKGAPTIVDASYAGHTAMSADYHEGQSLVETLLANGLTRVFLTDWKSATDDMKDLEIDQYLAEINVCVDDLGGRVNLVGLCQGGWMSAMYAARFPHKVASLVLAGSPIDTDAGDGPIKRLAHASPTSFFEELVAAGGGLMRGKFMLDGWKCMHPEEHYIKQHIDLYEHIDDPAWLKKEETFESWYENPIDLPGRWYLQAIVQGEPARQGRFCRAWAAVKSRYAEESHREEARAGRPYWLVHGLAHLPGYLAGDRALDQWPQLMSDLGECREPPPLRAPSETVGTSLRSFRTCRRGAITVSVPKVGDHFEQRITGQSLSL